MVPIAPKPAIIATSTKSSEKQPDFSMLNKPPPIPFYLPKAAALAPRNVSNSEIVNLNDTPEIALKKLETESTTLKEEVAALKWLAKRKEQEWNNIIELLKKKEETWLKIKRQAELAATDKAFHKINTVMQPQITSVSTTSTFASPVMPEPPPPIQIIRSTGNKTGSVTSSNTPPVISLPTSAGSNQRKVLVPVSQPLTPQTIQQLQSQGLLKSGGVTADGKRIIVVKKSVASSAGLMQKSLPSRTSTLPTSVTKVVMANSLVSPITATGQIVKNKNPICQECRTKSSKFECAGCSKMWYCSKECQEKNWSKHEKECGLTKTTAVIKQEITD